MLLAAPINEVSMAETLQLCKPEPGQRGLKQMETEFFALLEPCIQQQ